MVNRQGASGLASMAAVVRASAKLAAGRVVVLSDQGAGRRDLVAAAERIDGTTINFMTAHGRGLLYLVLPPERVERLGLRPMVPSWGAPERPLTISIEARTGISTGISAPERAQTIRSAVAADARPEDLISPGHVFPLRARPGGLLAGGGRIEAALELAGLGGSAEGAVMTEVLDDQGDLADERHVQALAQRFALEVVEVEDVARYLKSSALSRLDVARAPAVPTRATLSR